jgi:predicted component of type VI protein secretion system
MATVVPILIIIYSLTADDLTHQGQFWTLISDTHTKY